MKLCLRWCGNDVVTAALRKHGQLMLEREETCRTFTGCRFQKGEP